MPAIKRMLVPTDFSPASDIALTYAIDMALRHGAAIHLLYVVDEGSAATAFPDGFYVELPGLRAKLVDDATRRLTELTQQCAAASVPATFDVVTGRPAPMIAQEATARGTDLIVMATHGRSGVAHLLLGSVAERVLRTAPCPVLTVRDTARVADAVAAHAHPAWNPAPLGGRTS